MKLPPGYVEGQGVVKATAYGGFGERMLKTLGWEKGKGLGKEEQGMKEAIEVKKKEDTVGVGGGPVVNWNDAWWEDAFNSAVKGVPEHENSSSSNSDSDSEEDGDDIDGCSLNTIRVNRDGTLASGSAAELKLLEHLANSDGKVAAGRFGGRAGKMERIRAQEKMDAAKAAEKLGVKVAHVVVNNSDGSESTQTPLVKDDVVSSGQEAQGAANSSGSTRKRKIGTFNSKSGDVERPKRIVIECGSPENDVIEKGRELKQPTPECGWWGERLFVSVGALSGAALENPIKSKERGFSEDYQAKIFESAHAGKIDGRLKTGLGKGKRGTIKIGGATWEGKKTTFEDVEDDKIENSGMNPCEEMNRDKQIKFKSVIKAVLKEQSSSKGKRMMKLKELHSYVKAHITKIYSRDIRKRDLKQGVSRAIEKSSSWSINGKYVAWKK